MARAKFQVLVIPYMVQKDQIKYCTFLRSDMNIWQFIAGGGEDDETPIEAAKREAHEEANIAYSNQYYILDTCSSIPIAVIIPLPAHPTPGSGPPDSTHIIPP